LPLYTPADAQGYATSIRDGIDQFGWPEIEDMRGKFMWILTHGEDDYCDNDQDCGQRQAFVAQSVVDVTEIGLKSYSVFYNQNIAKERSAVPIGPAVYEAGYNGRVYHSDDIDTPEKWALAESNRLPIAAPCRSILKHRAYHSFAFVDGVERTQTIC
jgi:hypothetical protein